MTFKCSTEVEEFRPLPEGNYRSEILECQEKVSSKGNPMLVMDFRIFLDNGTCRNLTCFITEKMNWLIKHLWESVGEPEKFTGEWEAHEFIGKCPVVVLSIVNEKYVNKMGREVEATKNRISDFYIEQKEEVKKEDDFINDPIPF